MKKHFLYSSNQLRIFAEFTYIIYYTYEVTLGGGTMLNKFFTKNARFFILILMLLCAVYAMSSHADADGSVIIYVTKNGGSTTQNGLSWATAYPGESLQGAISDAAKYDSSEVWVASGDYTIAEPPIVMQDGIILRGGFAGTETFLLQRNIADNETILRVSSADTNLPTVVSFDSVTGAALDGFTITGAHVSGITISDCSKTTIANCIIRNNQNYNDRYYYGMGGGVYISTSDVDFANCAFTGNGAKYGGGVRNNSAANNAVTFTNCTFAENSADMSGSGINSAGQNGSSLKLTNCTFANGRGAETISGTGSFLFTNSIFWGNESAAISVDTSATVRVTNCVVKGGYTGGTNIVDSDPLLLPLDRKGVHASSKDIFIYALSADSPAIDSGTAKQAPDTDQRGVYRPQGAGFDIGAYEYIPHRGAPIITSPDVDKKLLDDAGDVSIKFGIESLDVVSIDGYQIITSVTDNRILTVSHEEPNTDNLPPCSRPFGYIGTAIRLDVSTLVASDKIALLPVTVTIPLSRANLLTLFDNIVARGGKRLNIDEVLASPDAYVEDMFVSLAVQKQLKEGTDLKKCTWIVPGGMTPTQALNSGVMSITPEGDGIKIVVKFYVADDAYGSGPIINNGNIIVGDGEHNGVIYDPLWANYRVSTNASGGAVDGGGGCNSLGSAGALLALIAGLTALGFKRKG